MRSPLPRRHRRPSLLVTAVLVPVAAATALVAVPSTAAAPVAGLDVIYTTDAHFDSGELDDVNHDAPGGNQLQLNVKQTPFPYVHVAASRRGTVLRIDVASGAVVGEWRTAPEGRGRNPSRTTVDTHGNVWVANRAELDGGKGSVTRIGVIFGGVRVDGDGAANPDGTHLKGPFGYNTCRDRNGDGLIATSRRLTDIRAWSNAGGVDNDGGVDTAADECITAYTRVVGTETRTVAVDSRAGHAGVWTGGLNDAHEKLDDVDGAPIAGTQFNKGCGGYGGLVDGSGVLWSARVGGSLLRYDPTTGVGVCLPGTTHGDYGLGIDRATGEIWSTHMGGDKVSRIAPNGSVIGTYRHGNSSAQGVAVDSVGNVWVAHSYFSGQTTVGHLRTDGTYVGNVELGPHGGVGPTGVAVDTNGKVWVTNLTTNNAMRIDPAAGGVGGGGHRIGAVDLTVDLGAGAEPYNYSDMTGAVLGKVIAPDGSWTVTQDSGTAGAIWGTITWNKEPQGSVPPGGAITVEARAADTEAGLAAASYVPVGNGTSFTMAGRYLQARTTLVASPDGVSPILSDLRIRYRTRPPQCGDAGPTVAQLWPPNHKFVPVQVRGVTDPDGDPITVTITGIRQDEPVDTTGDGHFAPDGRGVGTSTAELRAERSGLGDGRMYHVAFRAADGKGGACTGTVRIGVPHDQGGDPPVDGGPVYDSTTVA